MLYQLSYIPPSQVELSSFKREMETPSEAVPNEEDEEEYIDMEVMMPTQSREFEFQIMCLPPSSPRERETTISSADELFCNGKLVPFGYFPSEKPKSNLGFSFTAPTTTTTTPFESPSQSCRVSCEINRHDFNNVFNLSNEISSSSCSFLTQQGGPRRKLFWPSKKMMFIKQSSLLAQKLKASRSYLKSLFTKGGKNGASVEGNQYMTFSKLSNDTNTNTNTNNNENTVLPQRKSFSGAIKRHCGGVKCMSSFISPSASSSSSNCSSNSSSFSVKSDKFYELNFVKNHSRGTVMSSEIENAIEGAIAHCKNSQQQKQCIISATELKGPGSSLRLNHKFRGIVDHGRPELCRI